jgi:Mce-associated membrane protein
VAERPARVASAWRLGPTSRSDDDGPRTQHDVTDAEGPREEPFAERERPAVTPKKAAAQRSRARTTGGAAAPAEGPRTTVATPARGTRRTAPPRVQGARTASRTTSRSPVTARTAPAASRAAASRARAELAEPQDVDDEVATAGSDDPGDGAFFDGPAIADDAMGGTDPADPIRRRAGLFVPAWAAIVAGVVAVALVAGLVLTSLQILHDNSVSSSRTSALAAARTYAAELASYNYQSLSTDFGLVERHSTPAFRKSFVQSSDSLSKVLVQYHATAKATVAAAGLSSLSGDTAEALVFVNQTVTNTEQKSGPTTDASRVQIQLVRSGGTWLIDHVNLL